MSSGEKTPMLSNDKEQTPALRWQQELPARRVLLRQSLVTVQWIVLNIAATVTVVFINKRVFSDPQLKKCQMTVAAWHFLATGVVLYLASRVGMFPAVRIPIRTMLPISSFFAGFLILGNLSMTFNSLGFYQLAKVMTTPTVVLLNFILFGITITKLSFLAVVSVCVGVLLVLTTAIADNLLGTFIAVAAFTVTALYQIWIGKSIADLKISGSQLLSNQAPIAAAILLVLAPFIDTKPVVSAISQETLFALVASGVLASILNLSQFLVIERSNALTFNVISQVKTIIIVALSWYGEGRALTLMDVLGVALTLSGAYAYSILSICEKDVYKPWLGGSDLEKSDEGLPSYSIIKRVA